ncbi:nitrate regulatory gene2 protein-like protein [Tanacetum coccineum]
MYKKMHQRLLELDANRAESSKIDAAEASIRRLTTKLNVSIRAIDAISREIHKVRDKELQPQVSELIYGVYDSDYPISDNHFQYVERISKKRTKNKAKTTKPDTEWKSRKKTKSKSKPKCRKVNKSTPTNPKPKVKKSKFRD